MTQAPQEDPSAEDQRALILDAADAVLRERGALTIDQVVARAGVSRSTIYRAFGSRAGLIEALERRGGAAAARAAQADPPSARERVLQALSELVRERLLARLTVEEVAQAAGVSAVTIYRVFGDRDGMVRAFLASRSPGADALPLLDELERPVEEALVAFAERVVAFMSESRGLLLQLMLGAEEDREYLSRMRDANHRTRQAVADYMAAQQARGVLRDDQPPEDAARALLGLLLAFGLIDDAGPDAASRAVDAFLRGALKEHSR